MNTVTERPATIAAVDAGAIWLPLTDAQRAALQPQLASAYSLHQHAAIIMHCTPQSLIARLIDAAQAQAINMIVSGKRCERRYTNLYFGERAR